MIIDSHSHLVAPPGVSDTWTAMEGAGIYGGRRSTPVSDQDLIGAADRQIALMDEVGTDMQLTSPRPYVLKHSHKPGQIVHWWVENLNDAVAVQVAARPERLQGIGALPQLSGEPISVVFDELDRCINDLGFVGVLLNPDPGEGNGITPTMDSQYWFPLYEKLVEMDVPALLHCASCYGRENYSEHFISEESLAILSIIRGEVFDRFPTLKLVVPHGGGSVPYQAGRWIAHTGLVEGLSVSEATDLFRNRLRKFWFDTCLYTPESLELLFRVVGADRVLFGTERPGSGHGLEDIRPVIEGLNILSESDHAAVFEGNARTVYSRIE
jgi:4-oxalmesaconate hydratase